MILTIMEMIMSVFSTVQLQITMLIQIVENV